MNVVLSEHDLNKDEGFEQVRSVERTFVHNYNYKTFNNDIMLIKVGRASWDKTSVTIILMFLMEGHCGCLWACVTAEWAGAAERQRPAGWTARWKHPSTWLWRLHSERLGCDADFQLLPLPCAACCGRKNNGLLQLLLLGENHSKHAVCWISDGRQRLLPGTHFTSPHAHSTCENLI